jgi:ATP-dependent DNA helicase RecG
MHLLDSVTSISGIGSVMQKKLSRLGIETVFDIFYHLPFRFEDRSLISPISSVQPGETVTVIGKINNLKNDFVKGGRFIQKGAIEDNAGFQLPIVWFNQPFLTRTLKKGSPVAFYGKAESFRGHTTLVSPEYELIHDHNPLIHMGRIVPVYPETAGVTSKYLRTKIFSLLTPTPLQDFITPPPEILPWNQAVQNAHFPSHLSLAESGRKRLAFDELLFSQLRSLIRRENWKHTRLTHAFSINQESILQFISRLPFTLTPSQTISIKEILSDLSLPHPMNRLLEGDVGSGKTVVAAISAYVAHLNGFQTLLLAPTQILAQQHFHTLTALFSPFNIEVTLITAQSKKSPAAISQPIVVGTHALLSESRSFDKVGLVVIDEQHRFGVLQRGLAASKGTSPHILTMTATPIPRTVALSLYGDLDLSILSQTPSGRLPVKTWVVPEIKRRPAYSWISRQIKSTHTQAFIVCPFIEESESLQTVKAATTEFKKLEQIFPSLRLGLLHGRLKPSEKQKVMDKFRAGELHILVTTPVVEVGVDIPNATIMLIEGSQRFGLAQLHQLRGRVGRGSFQSYCLLFSDSDTTRLKYMECHNSGMELAEIDLKLRGPGELYGTAQHGLPNFKIAAYSDFSLIDTAKKVANEILSRLSEFPLLQELMKEDKITLVQPN